MLTTVRTGLLAISGTVWRFANARWGRRLHRGADSPSAAITMYCVYREARADVVRSLIQDLPEGSVVHLHALDSTASDLAEHTRSVGPGSRMPLFARLIEHDPPEPTRSVLLADDDVSFVGRDGQMFGAIARAAHLDLAMPAHVADSEHTFRVTEQKAFSTARETQFVEIGPMVLLSPRAFNDVFPFPESARMGWGLDVYWSMLASQGRRLGIVDATPMKHLGAVGANYDQTYERAQLAYYCELAGVESAYSLASPSRAMWRPWQSAPPWLVPRKDEPDGRHLNGR